MAELTVEPRLWGKDHYSALAYVEDGCVNAQGAVFAPKPDRLQTNFKRHRHLAGPRQPDGAAYGIRLSDGTELPGPAYDEWDCLDDFVREGYLLDVGTGLHRAYELTDKGKELCSRLRQHKAGGGVFSTFRPFGNA